MRTPYFDRYQNEHWGDFLPKEAYARSIHDAQGIFVHWGGREGAPYGGVHLEWNRTTGESKWEQLTDAERVNLAFSFHFNHSVSCEELGYYPIYDAGVCQTAFDDTGLPPHIINNVAASSSSFVSPGPNDPDTLMISDDGGALGGLGGYEWSPLVVEHAREWIFVDRTFNLVDEAQDNFGFMGGKRFERGCQLISGFPDRHGYYCTCYALEEDTYGTPRLIYNGETNNGVDDTLESGTSFRQDPTSNPWEYKPALVSYCSKTPGKCQGLNANDPAPPPPPLTPGALHSKDCVFKATGDTYTVCKCTSAPLPPPPPPPPETPPPPQTPPPPAQPPAAQDAAARAAPRPVALHGARDRGGRAPRRLQCAPGRPGRARAAGGRLRCLPGDAHVRVARRTLRGRPGQPRPKQSAVPAVLWARGAESPGRQRRRERRLHEAAHARLQLEPTTPGRRVGAQVPRRHDL